MNSPQRVLVGGLIRRMSRRVRFKSDRPNLLSERIEIQGVRFQLQSTASQQCVSPRTTGNGKDDPVLFSCSLRSIKAAALPARLYYDDRLTHAAHNAIARHQLRTAWR